MPINAERDNARLAREKLESLVNQSRWIAIAASSAWFKNGLSITIQKFPPVNIQFFPVAGANQGFDWSFYFA